MSFCCTHGIRFLFRPCDSNNPLFATICSLQEIGVLLLFSSRQTLSSGIFCCFKNQKIPLRLSSSSTIEGESLRNWRNGQSSHTSFVRQLWEKVRVTSRKGKEDTHLGLRFHQNLQDTKTQEATSWGVVTLRAHPANFQAPRGYYRQDLFRTE